MKKFFNRSFKGLLIVSLLLACTLAFVACGEKERHVVQPQVYNVTLSVAEGESLGLVGVTHTLAYEATEGSSVSVTASKNGITATANDYAYSADSKNIVFKTSGQYVVFVTATKDGLSYSGTIGITVYTQEDLVPVVSIGLTKITVNTPMPLYTVQYKGGAAKQTENISVEYRENADGEYAAATADTDYVVENGEFTAKHGSGTYRVTVQITDTHNGTASATTEITARAEPESLTITPSASFVEHGWNRVLSYATSVFGYTVSGDMSEYEIVVEGHDDLQLSAGSEGLSVTTLGVGTYTVSATYQHRGVATKKYTVSCDLQVVDNLDYSPVFSANPFGDTYGELIPSTGLMLYSDVYEPDGTTRLSGANITYSVTESHVVTSGGAAVTPVCMRAGDNANFPFVYVPNAGDNTATGSFTVKMLAEYNGYTAATSKTFTMTACGGTNDDNQEKDKLQTYFHTVVSSSNFVLNMPGNAMGLNARQNSVITRNGIIAQRNDTSGIGCVGLINVGGSWNCTVNFKLTRLKGSMNLGIGLRTNSFNGWADYIRIRASGSDPNKLTAEYDRTDDLSNVTKSETTNLPNINEYGVTYVRITRTRTGYINYTHTLKIEFSDDGNTYYQVYSATLGGSGNGKPGANLNALQFDHASGCFAIEDVTLTNS
ncbi:MAG: hypothetical protein K2M95_07185 [Clostridiales bacterium]|nr:hypothetical protein [Clostridiales bacterium]